MPAVFSSHRGPTAFDGGGGLFLCLSWPGITSDTVEKFAGDETWEAEELRVNSTILQGGQTCGLEKLNDGYLVWKEILQAKTQMAWA